MGAHRHQTRHLESDTWRGMSYQTVVTPADQKTSDVIYPYAKAKWRVF